MNSRTIGIFDSGVGGLTVLKSLVKALPGYNFVYFGDTARVPYGTKSPGTIIKYSLENAQFLAGFDICMLVVACNTSSAYAIEPLKEQFKSIPIVGVVAPGAKAAVSSTRTGVIGVIGTKATIKSRAYEREIALLNAECRVIGRACPLFVPLIEEGWTRGRIVESIAREYLDSLVMEGIDTLVLGCTHYPLIKGTIKKLYPHLNLVDSAEETAREVRKLLPTAEKKNSDQGTIRIFVSDKTQHFTETAELILGEKLFIEEVSFGKSGWEKS